MLTHCLCELKTYFLVKKCSISHRICAIQSTDITFTFAFMWMNQYGTECNAIRRASWASSCLFSLRFVLSKSISHVHSSLGKVMFLQASVILLTGGSTWEWYPRHQVHPPGSTPPGKHTHPEAPPGKHTPRSTPPIFVQFFFQNYFSIFDQLFYHLFICSIQQLLQAPPPIPPPPMVNEWPVRILLECILVIFCSVIYVLSCCPSLCLSCLFSFIPVILHYVPYCYFI